MNRRQVLKTIGLMPIISACTPTGRTGAGNILATTSQIGDIVQQLIGDTAAHSTLIRTGLDPHTYKATQSDLQRFNDARLILYNGLNLEASLERVLTQMPESIRVASLADAFEPSELLTSEDGNAIDPHIWFDIGLWRKAVAFVANVLQETDATLKSVINQRLPIYDGELVALKDELTAQIDQIPPARRILITAHDAFGYFGRAYGFEVMGIQGLSTATEAGIQDMSQLADVIVMRQVPAVFIESTVSPKTIEALQAAVIARGGNVALGGELYSDSLGDINTPAASYVGMLRHNVQTIVSALKGDA
ncbi:MAG: metal ABC transporter solute-binding protein, Zn/Mn family [Chloroflexota bacterium]|jgi:manganese/zinc/iron transport system substrate-binding protein